MSDLQLTPLDTLHQQLGARMVPFAGYSMPVQYSLGLIGEHAHTRNQAGLFDVSHMGQLRIGGDSRATALEKLVPIDVVDLPAGRQRYGRCCWRRPVVASLRCYWLPLRFGPSTQMYHWNPC